MLTENRDRLLGWFAPFQSCGVAFSGGVDSAVVAQAAFLAMGSRALAVTGVSASLAGGELDAAIQLARQIGIRHETITTAEFDNPDYVRNHPDRCYHCKSELYARLDVIAARCQVEVVVNGANADDADDYRPGMNAAVEHRVRSPLLECGITKPEVRELAAFWQLAVWDKPASPCLASRVVYGESVTPERLAMIDQAEQFLRERGFRVVRVRYHTGDLARIEVAREELPRLIDPAMHGPVNDYLTRLGFKFIAVDLAGFRSGSLNTLVRLGSSPAAR